MSWIVIGREKDKFKFVSKSSMDALLPKGYFITIDENDCNFILRVEDSFQDFPYHPSPMIIDMDLSPLIQDQKCQNTILAYPIKDLSSRTDGLINYIRPLVTARRSTQEEVDKAMGGDNSTGPKVFLGTIQGTENHILMDENGKFLTASLPDDFFFHQTMICGKTGSGKTVSTKYLAQYFVEQMEGAVLAINVKDIDFLTMDKASNSLTDQILKEWDVLGEEARGIESTVIYYPSTTEMKNNREINQDICKAITLDVTTIEPTSLLGVLQNISEIGSQYLPDIFRYWKEEEVASKKDPEEYFKFEKFVEWFASINKGKGDEKNVFPIKSARGSIDDVPLHHGTAQNVLRSLRSAIDFFDDSSAKPIDGNSILEPGKISIIDIQDERSKIFGSILLRQLLHHIVDLKSKKDSDVPVLVIIDEVHQFYNTDSSKEALGDLDTICRQGRSQKIGIIFSSQNPTDIPKGLSSVINTKIFFKSDSMAAKTVGISISDTEFENLNRGFAIVNVHDRPQLKVVKFPLSFAGVYKEAE